MGPAEIVHKFEQHLSAPEEKVVADLQRYADLLWKWQAAQNLVSRETLPHLWERHFADSLQVLPLLRDSDKVILDLGSGGGFPAIPLAIASRDNQRKFVLVEPNNRKASFLRTVGRELQLELVVLSKRSDQVDSRETVGPDVITSRALAALPRLCEWMLPFWQPATRAILHKGREHGEEIASAATHYHFDVLITPSVVAEQSALLTIKNLQVKSTA